MEAERWQRVKEIFHAARTRGPEERPSFLRALCDGDDELREEVESLLAQEGQTQGFIEAPLFERTPDVEDEAPETEKRERIGPYRLLYALGHGGMGTVYLAERDDSEFERQVAVKLIKRGMDTDEVIHRFRYERQILANLHHPRIAELYDGGTTDDGLPYFAMEYVEGEPIHHYCGHRGLGLRGRLELFHSVCEVVDFAHRNLVVHRDLKPANILVSSEGEPKLLDFGIAKLLAPGGAAEPTQGVLGGRFMTPGYASPEQLRGEAVTTASDVYSLGVLLYELLTGERPFAERDSDPFFLDPAELEREPPRPSSVVSRRSPESLPEAVPPLPEEPKQLKRRLTGDLDAIVCKALRTESDRRYRSAAELAEDVEHYLEGRPVGARRGTWAYRARKFVQRNLKALVTAVVITLLGLGFAGTYVWSQIQEERLAEEQRRAGLLEQYLIDVFGKSAPGEGDLTAPAILESGAGLIADGVFDEELETKATFQSAIGEIYRQRGEYGKALSLQRDSVDLRRELYGSDSEPTVRSENNLALTLKVIGQFGEAEHLLEGAVSWYRQAQPGSEPLAKAVNNLADVKEDLNKSAEAAAFFKEALDLKRELYGDKDHQEIALALHNYSVAQAKLGNFIVAEDMEREALAMRERLFGVGAFEVLSSYSALGGLLCNQGKYAEGQGLLELSLRIRQENYEPPHRRIAHGLRNLGVCLQLQGKLEASDERLAEARVMLEQNGFSESDRATTLREIASLRLDQGRPAEAEQLVRRAIEIFGKLPSPVEWRIADANSVLGAALLAQGNAAEAELLLRESAEVLRQARGEHSRQYREAQERLGALEAASN